jgi:hypothetical protein
MVQSACDNLFRLLTSSLSPLTDTSDAKEVFLPALESLSCTSNEHMNWHLVLDIFGPLPEIHSPHRRPLTKLNILLYPIESSPYIDKDSITRFLKLREAGITLDFRLVSDDGDLDFVKLSMNHHGIKEEKPGLPSSC